MLPHYCPRLRSDVEVLLVEDGGDETILLQDPEHYAPDVARLAPAAVSLLRYFDGRHTFEQMQVRLEEAGVGDIATEDLRAFADALDQHYLLESERFGKERERRESFHNSSQRRAAHEGTAYPATDAEASSFLESMLSLAPAAREAPLRRLIAPHIDLGLGAEVYAHAHRRLLASGRPDLVVILGVCHSLADSDFIACRKDFVTPRGTLRHDGAFLDILERRVGYDLSEGDLVHRDEHSVEFQALWLAHLWPEDPPPIVPFLVRGFHECVVRDRLPGEQPEIEEVIDALRETIREDPRRILVLASVDLAHMGPMYDDDTGLDAEGEMKMERDDRALLDHVARGDANGFFHALCAEKNERNVCGAGPIYVALRLGEGPGELLRYGQGRIHPQTGSVVSFAALAFPD